MLAATALEVTVASSALPAAAALSEEHARLPPSAALATLEVVRRALPFAVADWCAADLAAIALALASLVRTPEEPVAADAGASVRILGAVGTAGQVLRLLGSLRSRARSADWDWAVATSGAAIAAHALLLGVLAASLPAVTREQSECAAAAVVEAIPRPLVATAAAGFSARALADARFRSTPRLVAARNLAGRLAAASPHPSDGGSFLTECVALRQLRRLALVDAKRALRSDGKAVRDEDMHRHARDTAAIVDARVAALCVPADLATWIERAKVSFMLGDDASKVLRRCAEAAVAETTAGAAGAVAAVCVARETSDQALQEVLLAVTATSHSTARRSGAASGASTAPGEPGAADEAPLFTIDRGEGGAVIGSDAAFGSDDTRGSHDESSIKSSAKARTKRERAADDAGTNKTSKRGRESR